MIVNAEGLVAGRLASKIAKVLIKGESVVIVNAEEAIIVGKKEDILAKYKQRVDARVLSNPHYGPKYQRIPSRILKRMINGMLPNKKTTAKKIISNLKIYNNIPGEYVEEKFEEIKEANFNEKHDFMKLNELAKLLGGKW